MDILYTDLQDGDRQGIEAAEKQLDAWFGKRSQAGKEQSVIVKQWGGGGGSNPLLKVLSQSPNIKTFHAAELTIEPLTVEPKIIVKAVKRQGDVIHVHLLAGGRVKGRPADITLGELEFRCVSSTVKGDRVLRSAVGSAVQATVEIAAPGNQRDNTIVLPFTVALKAVATNTMGVLQRPVLTTSRMEVTVKIPKPDVNFVVTATVDMKEPPIWEDPIALVARYPMTLVFDVPPTKEGQLSDESSFRISSRDSCQVIEGNTTFTMSGPGHYRIPLVVRANAINPGVQLDQVRFRLALDIKPIRVPPNVHWQPDVLSINRSDLLPPDPLVSLVESQLVSIDRVVWFSLEKSLAVIDAKVAINTVGSVPPSAKCVLSKPPGVHEVVLQPDGLRSGRHIVAMRCIASVEPHPRKATFSFRVLPKAPRHGGVELLATDPLQITLNGPRTAQLLLTDGRAVIDQLHRSVADNCRVLQIDVVPWMHGIHSRMTARNCRIKLVCRDHEYQLADTSLRLFERQRLSLRLQRREVRSFFRDQQEHVEISITPEGSMPTVAPVRVQGVITRRAPFRRLLVYLSIAVCSVGAVALLVRLVVKLREPVE